MPGASKSRSMAGMVRSAGLTRRAARDTFSRMRLPGRVWVGLALLASCARERPAPPSPPPDPSDASAVYDAALGEAGREDKSVLVHFRSAG